LPGTRLEGLARQETAPAAAFAYGRLHAHEEARGQLAVIRFETAWGQAREKVPPLLDELPSHPRAGSASGLLNTSRQLGGALAVPVFGALHADVVPAPT
jgi:hypothetical protein